MVKPARTEKAKPAKIRNLAGVLIPSKNGMFSNAKVKRGIGEYTPMARIIAVRPVMEKKITYLFLYKRIEADKASIGTKSWIIEIGSGDAPNALEGEQHEPGRKVMSSRKG